MREALRAEWTKLRTLAGTGWLLAGAVAGAVVLSATVAATVHVSSPGSSGGSGGSGNSGRQDPTRLSLIGVDLGQAMIAVLAVVTISEEYGTGMIRSTLAAVPRRLLLFFAKAANVTGLTLVAGLLAVAGCLTVGRLILPSHGLDPAHGYALVAIGHGPTLRAAVGSVLYLVGIALLSLGVATAIRDTAVSIGAVLSLLYLPPVLAQAVTGPWRRHLQQISPMTAGLTSQTTANLRSLPIGPWAGLGVLAAWAAASLLLGGLLLRQRDA
jgi:ABC-2 type transport system permease protein